MGFRIKSRDVTIEVDSDRELRAVLSILGLLPHGMTSAASETRPDAGQPPPRERMLRFYSRLAEGHQLVVIKALARATVALTDVELRGSLGLRSNSQLAGVMAGLSKNAKANRLAYQDIIEKQRSDGRDGSLYLYSLTPAMREIMSATQSQQLWQQNDAEGRG